jgi:hypothetical protein
MSVAAADVEPVLHETRDRIITGLVTALPMLALAVAAGARPMSAMQELQDRGRACACRSR